MFSGVYSSPIDYCKVINPNVSTMLYKKLPDKLKIKRIIIILNASSAEILGITSPNDFKCLLHFLLYFLQQTVFLTENFSTRSYVFPYQYYVKIDGTCTMQCFATRYYECAGTLLWRSIEWLRQCNIFNTWR